MPAKIIDEVSEGIRKKWVLTVKKRLAVLFEESGHTSITQMIDGIAALELPVPVVSSTIRHTMDQKSERINLFAVIAIARYCGCDLNLLFASAELDIEDFRKLAVRREEALPAEASCAGRYCCYLYRPKATKKELVKMLLEVKEVDGEMAAFLHGADTVHEKSDERPPLFRGRPLLRDGGKNILLEMRDDRSRVLCLYFSSRRKNWSGGYYYQGIFLTPELGYGSPYAGNFILVEETEENQTMTGIGGMLKMVNESFGPYPVTSEAMERLRAREPDVQKLIQRYGGDITANAFFVVDEGLLSYRILSDGQLENEERQRLLDALLLIREQSMAPDRLLYPVRSVHETTNPQNVS